MRATLVAATLGLALGVAATPLAQTPSKDQEVKINGADALKKFSGTGSGNDGALTQDKLASDDSFRESIPRLMYIAMICAQLSGTPEEVANNDGPLDLDKLKKELDFLELTELALDFRAICNRLKETPEDEDVVVLSGRRKPSLMSADEPTDDNEGDKARLVPRPIDADSLEYIKAPQEQWLSGTQ